MPAGMTDTFKRLNNPDITKMKSAHVRAANLGPGVPQNSLDTFRLLKQDPQLQMINESQNAAVKEGLANRVDSLVRQREDFQK